MLPREPAFGGLTVKAVILQAGKCGLTFHGSKVNENTARAPLNVAPFAHDTRVQTAFKAFEDVSFGLDDQTKISMLMHAATKHFGQGREAAIGACVQIFWALRAGLLYKDIVKDSHVTKEFLVGARNKAGFALLFSSAVHSWIFLKL